MEDTKQAVLIMAHNNWNSLEKLIRFFDSNEIEIFLHIDKKAKDFNKQHFINLCNNAKINLIKRRNVRWGTNDQILCEMDLFKEALKKGPFLYYHLISGNDVPLVPLNEFLNFFKGKSKNFLIADEEPQFEIRFQIYFNIFEKLKILPQSWKQYLNKKSNALQIKIGVNRLKKLKDKFPIIRQGHNWCNLKQKAVEILISKEKEIKKISYFTSCGDEMYKQIILCNSEIATTLTNDDIRAIDWTNGGPHPKTFSYKDLTQLQDYKRQGKLLARKFDENLDNSIIEKLYLLLENQPFNR